MLYGLQAILSEHPRGMSAERANRKIYRYTGLTFPARLDDSSVKARFRCSPRYSSSGMNAEGNTDMAVGLLAVVPRRFGTAASHQGQDQGVLVDQLRNTF